MKKLLILTLLFAFCMPVFSYEKKYTSYGAVDDSVAQAYGRKLEKEYWAKVDKGEVENTRRTYVHYVEIPLMDFYEQLEKEQKKSKNR